MTSLSLHPPSLPIPAGTLLQLVLALIFTLSFMLVDGVIAPHRLPEDDYFSLAINFALAAVFVFCIVLKTVRRRMSPTRRSRTPTRPHLLLPPALRPPFGPLPA